ncbi:hypothetical protein GCM10020229_71590 [Kitasatospora albolonga]
MSPAPTATTHGLWIELDAILAVVVGGTSLNGGRFSLGGTVLGALVIQTLSTTVYTIGIPPENHPGLQGRRGDHRLPGPVARLPGQGRPTALPRQARRPPVASEKLEVGA